MSIIREFRMSEAGRLESADIEDTGGGILLDYLPGPDIFCYIIDVSNDPKLDNANIIYIGEILDTNASEIDESKIIWDFFQGGENIGAYCARSGYYFPVTQFSIVQSPNGLLKPVGEWLIGDRHKNMFYDSISKLTM